MARHLRNKPRVWRIDRDRGASAEYLGIVVAPDIETAIEQACKKFGINPEQRKELVARELPRDRAFPVRRGPHAE